MSRYMHKQLLYRNYLILVSVEQANCTNGAVRLVDGSEPHEGRVEVCVNEAWGTVCSNSWNSAYARVVCAQLGYLSLGLFWP